jgi:predicted AAA+ superfamily ATPase
VLARSIDDTDYYDCELPSVRRELRDPERFLDGHAGRRVVLDEIHRLDDPSELLKIAADHHPRVRVLATGSSSLGARAKFRDTLAGRKHEVWLTPMTVADTVAFGQPSVEHRMARGGLPPFFLAKSSPERDYQEWLDAYWAKDVQELFRLEKRGPFARLFEMLLVDSGGIFEATRFARACEVSRQTVMNYLEVLESTFVMHVVRPFASNPSAEIVAAPRVYGFDTGFVAYHRGWSPLRRDDYGPLWEHLVLNELYAARQRRDVQYWRTKSGHEVDFIVAPKRSAPTAIECKWSEDAFDPAGMLAFRERYPTGENILVAADTKRASRRRLRGLEVRVVGLAQVADLAE